MGIELCQEAVEDARVNANNNGESQWTTQWAVPTTIYLNTTPESITWHLGWGVWGHVTETAEGTTGPLVYTHNAWGCDREGG